jgi:methyltransferase (TIGR00027 family)
MQDLTASTTALATSLMRALHTRIDPNPLINDPWGDVLVPEAIRQRFRDMANSRRGTVSAIIADSPRCVILDDLLQRSVAYSNVILRSRHSEERLEAAVARGILQYVIIGAGFDSFALRLPAFSRHLQIYEIDHPATQRMKAEQLKRCGVTLPGSVHFIGADLSSCTVASALAGSAFRFDEATFFSWLGVTMYLTRVANLTTLRSIAANCAHGSEIAFTYLDERLLSSSQAEFRELRDSVASVGEPFQSGFDPSTIGRSLSGCGLALLEDMNELQMATLYGRTDLGSGAFSHFSRFALARIDQSPE